MQVMKFGGTSVGDAARIAAVAEIVAAARDDKLVVVASAMSKVTNQLIEGARLAAEGQDAGYRAIKASLTERHLQAISDLLGDGDAQDRLEVTGYIEDRLHDFERLCRSVAVLRELTVRALDAIASIGEHLSCPILAARLRRRGRRAQFVSAAELVVTDDHFGAANPLMDRTRERVRERLLPLLEKGIIPVVTGYVGATARGVTSTLGRGGSDYSAAILGASLDAGEVWIWTDVDGILTADPKIVPQARVLDELTYMEAAELAYFGANVLHPKTIKPLAEKGIPLRIVNSFNPTHPGTLIVEKPSASRRDAAAIISTEGLSLVTVGGGESWSPLTAARALQRLADAGVEVLMFSQSFSERSLSLVVRRDDEEHGLRLLGREFESDLKLGAVTRLAAQQQVATVSVVGMPGQGQVDTLPRAFAALGRHGTRVILVAQAASEYNVTFVVPECEVESVVQFIHRELALGKNGAS